MPRFLERVLLLISDFLALNLAFFLWEMTCRRLGFFLQSDISATVFFPVILFIFWASIFLFFGLYRSWYAQSRLDELITLLKSVTFGIFLIFLLPSDFKTGLGDPLSFSRLLILLYWLLIILAVGAGRMTLRTFQRKLLEAGIGLRKTLIVGWNGKAKELANKMKEFPALGHKVIGFVTVKDRYKGDNHDGQLILGSIQDLPTIIKKENVEEVVIALDQHLRKKVLDVISACNGLSINIKIAPDLYDIIMGQVRTNQIYGFPLIEVLPEFMPAWERKAKRMIDIGVSVLILIVTLPLLIILALAIKVDSRGSLFYKQKRVGREGKIFTIFKFRSMVKEAEKMTGPVWAHRNDPRFTRVGRIMRKLRLDEIPQFVNVLKGDMSLIGPRPERPYFVKKFKKEIPLYSRRLKVRPGITGWAQIKHNYDSSIEDVKKKLQYDLFYLENMSLRMDMKILLSTLYVMFTGKGQ